MAEQTHDPPPQTPRARWRVVWALSLLVGLIGVGCWVLLSSG